MAYKRFFCNHRFGGCGRIHAVDLKLFIILLVFFFQPYRSQTFKAMNDKASIKRQGLKTSQRIGWIDWMKSIGIYFIVLGHFFSVGDKFIYVFNVPLFFVISGFLSKRETDNKVFWKKLWYNLIVPMLIISTINYLYACAQLSLSGTFEWKSIVYFIFHVLLGFQAGVGTCWFVYTLVILKIVHQYCQDRTLLYGGIAPALIAAYLYNHVDLSHISGYLSAPNSIVNTCTAFPFFAAGIFLKTKKDNVNSLNSSCLLCLVFLAGASAVYLSGHFNDYVWMYHCGYGNNFFWFLTGGMAGMCSIFAMSKILNHTPAFILTVSKGTILILGFHGHLIALFRKFFCIPIADFAIAALIVAVFVPIIMVIEKHFPLILGKYRISSG